MEAPTISSELPQTGHPSVLSMTKSKVLQPLPAAGARDRHREPPGQGFRVNIYYLPDGNQA